ncbi:DUF4124 domain-containing protein [Dokdonella sp.]|uniref:DUF4124 domain-containing protein n=1 Tax=Dokdonella sp. TaxID=2291710 RepID=UPI0035288C4F
MKPRFIVLLLICLGAAPVSAQQVYSWTDSNGTKHFSDTPPPPNTPSAKKLNVRSGVSTEETMDDVDETPKEGPQMAAAAGYSTEDIERNCAAARKNLETYRAGNPGSDAEPEAQIRYQENINKASDQIKLFCG